MIYRLYCELVVPIPEFIEECSSLLTPHGISAWTLIPASGVWEGDEEQSVIVEVITTEGADYSGIITDLGVHLRDTYHQQAVLMTAQPATNWLL